MSFRFVCVGLFTLAVGWLVPEGLAGQDPQDAAAQASADSLTLAFEREVFTYPDYARRNPFKSLLGGDEGPRFESLLLLGILYSPFAGESIALLAEGTRSITPATAGASRDVYRGLDRRHLPSERGSKIVGNGNVTVRTIET